VKGVVEMNESELNQIVEARLGEQLAARLQADRNRVREEVISALRREAAAAHHARVNARAPIEDKYSGLGREGHEARLRQMDAARARANAHMDEVNSRPVEGSLAHRRSLVPGSEGFAIKGVGQR
jgi:hypothetical protein